MHRDTSLAQVKTQDQLHPNHKFKNVTISCSSKTEFTSPCIPSNAVQRIKSKGKKVFFLCSNLIGTISALKKTLDRNILSNVKSQFYSFITSNAYLLSCLH